MEKVIKKLFKKSTVVNGAMVFCYAFAPVINAAQTANISTPIYNNKFYKQDENKKAEGIFAEDYSQILYSTKEQLNAWEKQRRYVKDWNMASTGMYKQPSQKQQATFIGKRFIKYFDRWVAQAAKKSKKPVFKKAAKTQKTLSPKKKLGLSDDFKLSFGAHALRAKAY
ncbi:MAG: hypothetical protein OXB84_00640, partial [Halobacteriovoraceae bacterium]|nr:hypothetical protein [Halobacteriovoraceae bacterium]